MMYPDISKPGQLTVRFIRSNEFDDIFEVRENFQHLKYTTRPRTLGMHEEDVYYEEVH